MRRTLILAFSIACASFLPGCEEPPKYSVSDPKSLNKLKKGLSDSEKNQLAEDLQVIGAALTLKATQSGDPKAFPKNYNQDADGLTVAEIHAKAEAIRASKSR